MNHVFLGLGSNVGDREKTMDQALRALHTIGRVITRSSWYETEPVGLKDQPLFLNMVVEIETDLPPHELLVETKRIEDALGRVRTIPNGPRTIDIDILLYGDTVVSSETLVVPHSRLYERAFVLVPLAEVAPDAVHPILKKNIGTLLAELVDRDNVSLYGTKNS